jgi:hypothetical protein
MKKLLFAAATLLISSQVWADIYLEPYVGYQFGKSTGSATITPGGNLTIDEKDSGTAFGAKVGYSVMGFAFGADYMATSLTGKDQTTPPGADSKWKGTNIGAFAQFTLPILLKFSATYFASAKLKDDTEITGNGFKVGVGFTFLPMLSVNLDMISMKYDKGSGGTGFVFNSLDSKMTTTMLSVSLPLNL